MEIIPVVAGIVNLLHKLKQLQRMCTRMPSNGYCSWLKKVLVRKYPFYNFIADI